MNDLPFLKFSLNSVRHLSPSPYKVALDINDGDKPLKIIRSCLFDLLFEKGCDVVLSCDSDFWLFPSILENVRDDIAMSFAELKHNISDL